MKVFTNTLHCLTNAHCRVCRNLKGGRAWRVSLASAFELPDGAPDFECPHGKPWGYVPEGKPAAALKAAPVPAYAAERRVICDACDVAAEKCGVKHRRLVLRKECWFTGYIRRPGTSCPADPPRWTPCHA